MPAGYKCCDTGFYCEKDEECVLDTGTGLQYCVSSDPDSADATRTASSDSTGSTSASGDDDDSAAAEVLGSKTWALLPVLGAMLVWL